MPNIKGIDGMSPQEISFEINRGGKFVRYRYCYSMLVLTMRESTAIYFVRADESRLKRGLHGSAGAMSLTSLDWVVVGSGDS